MSVLVCGLSESFQRSGVEEKVDKADVGNSAVVVRSGLERVVRYHHLPEGIAGVPKRKGFLLPLFGGGDGVCGLDVHLPRPAIDDEVDFVLPYRMLSGGVVVALPMLKAFAARERLDIIIGTSMGVILWGPPLAMKVPCALQAEGAGEPRVTRPSGYSRPRSAALVATPAPEAILAVLQQFRGVAVLRVVGRGVV